MSHAATSWAFAQKIESSTKFVLVALADYAKKGERRVYPSTETLQTKTCLDRKTILAALKRLRDLDLIQDTGNRIGKTRSIPVYELHLEAVPKTEQVQKRSSSENGTTSSPKNGTASPPQVIYSEPEKEPEVIIYKPRPSTLEETVSFITSLGLPASDGESLWDKWQGNGFTNNGKKMHCWKSTARNWKRMGIFTSQKLTGRVSQVTLSHNPNFTAENNPYKGAGIK